MTMMSSELVVKARTLLRQAGMSRRFVTWRRAKGYEQSLTNAMRSVVHSNAVVWDVGANIGVYSLHFADWVGPCGHVHSFEPARANAERLRAAVSSRANIDVLQLGLSNEDKFAGFHENEHPNGATFTVARPGKEANCLVELATGDALVSQALCAVPNVIKIDIEGHELEALQGMQQTLRRAECQHVFVEVHFFILSRERRDWVPRKIEEILGDCGFKLRWVDQSHIHGAKTHRRLQ
ncbi:FkbM family methyltransferase [Sphingomonas sp. F9_3S_D5_B_2]